MEPPPEPVIWGVPVDTFHYFGGHFGELILEASPLRTGPLFDTFHYFGGHFGELIDGENRSKTAHPRGKRALRSSSSGKTGAAELIFITLEVTVEREIKRLFYRRKGNKALILPSTGKTVGRRPF